MMRHFFTAAFLLLVLTGCGVTKQYMIPKDAAGELIHEARGKLRLARCVNCSLWGDDEKAVSSYLPVHAEEGIEVEINASYRCFGWFLVIPFPIWGGCSSAIALPKRQVIHIRISNTGKQPWAPRLDGVKAFKGTRELKVRQSQSFPDEIHPGESIIRVYDVGGWGDVGWGYGVDLSGLVGEMEKPTAFERFTTTTFGFYLR